MKRRDKPRIDYKESNLTGKKVIKETRDLEKLSAGFENLATMASKQRQNLIDDEKKLVRKLRRCLEEYDDLSLMFDVEEVETAISEFKEAIEAFDEIHIELERESWKTSILRPIRIFQCYSQLSHGSMPLE